MRLIDADALPKYTGYALSAAEVAKAVENAPTIEAEPVKYGKWEGLYNQYDAPYSVCSLCKSKIYRAVWVEGDGSVYGKKRGYAYCPNCGATMEEVR